MKIKQLLTAAMEKKSFDFSFSLSFFLPLVVPRCRSSPGEDYTGSSRSIKKSDTFAIHPQHVAMVTTQGCTASICKQDGKTKNRRMRRKTHIYFLIVMVLWMLCKDGLNTDGSFRCRCCLCVCVCMCVWVLVRMALWGHFGWCSLFFTTSALDLFGGYV